MVDALFTWPNPLEVTVLFLFFYVILNFIKGTRGAALIKGIVFFVIIGFISAMYVSEKLNLGHIKQMLQWLLSGSFIVLIIIFAPEIRRGLMRLAESPLMSPFLRVTSQKMIDQIVEAAANLAQKRIGAIIVLEREVGLGEYIENAVKVDAAVSQELIESLFHPGSILHDGAIVLQHERVAAAGCLLPLSDDPNLPKTVGTRHRAAMGITEETDALAIVVSEETGTLSFCFKGRLMSQISRERLAQLVREVYVRADRTGALRRLWAEPKRSASDPSDAPAKAEPFQGEEPS